MKYLFSFIVLFSSLYADNGSSSDFNIYNVIIPVVASLISVFIGAYVQKSVQRNQLNRENAYYWINIFREKCEKLFFSLNENLLNSRELSNLQNRNKHANQDYKDDKLDDNDKKIFANYHQSSTKLKSELASLLMILKKNNPKSELITNIIEEYSNMISDYSYRSMIQESDIMESLIKSTNDYIEHELSLIDPQKNRFIKKYISQNRLVQKFKERHTQWIIIFIMIVATVILYYALIIK